MKLLEVKTARFAVVVQKCGTPQVYTLWQRPKEDRHLQAQVNKCRIMSIQQPPEGAEFGCVGLFPKKGVIHLEFPKSLKRFEDRRIVGIKWELVKK